VNKQPAKDRDLHEPEQLLPRLPLRLEGSGGEVEPAQRGRASVSLAVSGVLDDPAGRSGTDDDEHDDGDDDVK